MYSGIWVGRTPDRMFETCMRLAIAGSEDSYAITLMDRKLARLEPRQTAIRNGQFAVRLPNWLFSEDIAVEGTFAGDGLHLKVKGAGMVGLLEYELLMHREETKPLEKETQSLEGLSELLQREFSGPHEEPTVPRIEGLIVFKEGSVLMEEYFNGFTATDKHNTASVMKSITSLVFGVLYDQGLANLDDLVADVFGYPASWTSPVTIRHLLSMTAGRECGMDEAQKLLRTTNAPRLLSEQHQVSGPGRFAYDNCLPCVVAAYIERQSGMSFRNFSETYLFGPLGITDIDWTCTREASVDGTPMVMASGGLHIRLQDLAKIAQMMLAGGIYGGRRILSAEYIALATSQQTATDDYPYGFFWHIDPARKGYWAKGQGGQYIGVFPEASLALAINSSAWHSPDYESHLFELIFKYLYLSSSASAF